MTTFKGKREALLNAQLELLRSGTTTVVDTLAQLNLPGAIEALENPVSVPKAHAVPQHLLRSRAQAILDKAEEVRTSGGATYIQKKIDVRCAGSCHVAYCAQEAAGLAAECQTILQDVVHSLEAEQREDEVRCCAALRL